MVRKGAGGGMSYHCLEEVKNKVLVPGYWVKGARGGK